MEPKSPVLPSSGRNVQAGEHLIAKAQAHYQTLPALVSMDPKGRVTSRWHLNWRERFIIFAFGDLWLEQLAFHKRLQPVRLTVDEPRAVDCI